MIDGIARVAAMYSTWNLALALGLALTLGPHPDARPSPWVLEAARGSALLVAAASLLHALTLGPAAWRALLASVLRLPPSAVPPASSALVNVAVHLGPVALLGAPTRWYACPAAGCALALWYAALGRLLPGGVGAVYSAPGHAVDRAYAERLVLPGLAVVAATAALWHLARRLG